MVILKTGLFAGRVGKLAGKLAARLAVSCCMALLCACDNFPEDPQNTLLEAQQRGSLYIGLVEYPPWVYRHEDGPQGVEVGLVADFAASLGLAPHWQYLPETLAMEKLKHRELDLVIGGLTRANPRSAEVSFTRPYLQTGKDKKQQHVMAVPPGENRILVTLEKFLLTQQEVVRKIELAEAAP